MTDRGGSEFTQLLEDYKAGMRDLRATLDAIRERLDHLGTVIDEGGHSVHLARERAERQKAVSDPSIRA